MESYLSSSNSSLCVCMFIFNYYIYVHITESLFLVAVCPLFKEAWLGLDRAATKPADQLTVGRFGSSLEARTGPRPGVTQMLRTRKYH